MSKIYFGLLVLSTILFACKKSNTDSQNTPVTVPSTYSFTSLKVNDVFNGFTYHGINHTPTIKITFSSPINLSSINNNIIISDANGNKIAFTPSLENDDNTVVITPTLQAITKYILTVNTGLLSKSGSKLLSSVVVNFTTAVDNTDKFTRISDNELLTLVQKQTFKYFWDFGHPTSGLARERDSSGDLVTSGGSGFGIMAIITGISRGFITHAEGLARMQKMVSFLKNTAIRYHGAYPHWLNGATGATIPFSDKDNGGDLVETAYLMQGLITARQYFDASSTDETTLRNDINTIYNGVEWSWYRKNDSNTLYWHWSPNYGWDMNFPIKGWNECLITYVMAASSSTYPIPKIVYDNGWAANGAIKNNNTYYGVQLPLGENFGGPLFFSHYSFLGINPMGLVDTYANYETQTKAHTLINYNYCVANAQKNGYSANCWGLTASDIPDGYTASSPTNDVGVIAPTAALSSFPYTPDQSMAALQFFYYKLGDKIWKNYGFVDSFKLNDAWFASSTLAIDQGPIIIMIENYRTKLLWNLFMSAPEVKTGMKNLGFSSPNL